MLNSVSGFFMHQSKAAVHACFQIPAIKIKAHLFVKGIGARNYFHQFESIFFGVAKKASFFMHHFADTFGNICVYAVFRMQQL